MTSLQTNALLVATSKEHGQLFDIWYPMRRCTVDCALLTLIKR